MLDKIVPIILVLLSVVTFVFSRNDSYHQKAADNYGLEWADTAVKRMRMGSYAMFTCAVLWSLSLLMK